MTQGVQATSLQEIADRLGITKPALYYHFASREELVRSIVTPILDDGGVRRLHEAAHEHDPRALLEGFFDLHLKHRDILLLARSEMTTLADLGLLDLAIGWRTRVGELLVGPDAPLARQCQAVVALGGMADCAWAFEQVPVETLRPAAVDAACLALGIT